MTRSKAAQLQHDRDLLLQLANGGIMFMKHQNPEYIAAYKHVKGVPHFLVYKNPGHGIVPKFNDAKHFWRIFDMEHFNDTYKWTTLNTLQRP